MSKILSVKLICALSFNDLDSKIDNLIQSGYQPYKDSFQQIGDENTNGYEYSSNIYVCQKMVKK